MKQKKEMTNRYIHEHLLAINKVLDKLAAYEDTGLEPEEVAGIEMSESPKGCPYCQEIKTLGFDAINDGIYIFRTKDEAVIESDTWEIEIAYCPKCGKKLSNKKTQN